MGNDLGRGRRGSTYVPSVSPRSYFCSNCSNLLRCRDGTEGFTLIFFENEERKREGEGGRVIIASACNQSAIERRFLLLLLLKSQCFDSDLAIVSRTEAKESR